MKRPAKHLEMMESRTLLSSTAPVEVFAFSAHSVAFAEAIAPHLIHVQNNNANVAGGGHDEGSAALDFHFESLDVAQDLHPDFHDFRIYTPNHRDGWYGHSGDGGDASSPAQAPPPDAPPPDAAHLPSSDDSDGRVTAKPARVPKPSDDGDATPLDVSEAMIVREALKPTAVAESTTLLHEVDSTTSAIAHAGSESTSPFAAISAPAAQHAGRSNMIYLSFLDQVGGSDPILASWAARLRATIVSLPAIVLRETGVAVFASGQNIHASIASPKTFEFAHFSSPLMLVADSIGSFIQASTMMPFTHTPAAAARRAWVVTTAVLGVDAILLGYYYHKRRKALADLAMETVMSA